jgi:hypothetical protein
MEFSYHQIVIQYRNGRVARPGFEPGQAEPKSAVLPLYYRAKEAKIMYFEPGSNYVNT